MIVPPLKAQGIKTKLLGFIGENTAPSEGRLWVEPFFGTGAAGLNLAAEHAVFADSNPHIIRFYRSLQDGEITPASVRVYLEREGALLSERGQDHYLAVRERFNREGSPLDFLFLSRSCFNGLMRFNRKGEFNVPFCKKPGRFSKAYITKIVNQTAAVAERIRGRDWTFLDASGSPWAVSGWLSTRHRENPCIQTVWAGCRVRTARHYYHAGGRTANRGAVTEVLLTNY